MTVFSHEDFADLLTSEASRAAASPIIDGAQSELEGWLGKLLEETEITDEIHAPQSRPHPGGPAYGPADLHLRWGPVREITNVAVDGEDVEEVSFTRRLWGISGLALSGAVEEIAVSYVAGFTDGELGRGGGAHDAVAVLRKVLRRELSKIVLDRNPGVQSSNVEGESVTYADGLDHFTDADLKPLWHLKRRKV